MCRSYFYNILHAKQHFICFYTTAVNQTLIFKNIKSTNNYLIERANELGSLLGRIRKVPSGWPTRKSSASDRLHVTSQVFSTSWPENELFLWAESSTSTASKWSKWVSPFSNRHLLTEKRHYLRNNILKISLTLVHISILPQN